jgi:hypothetical protein
MIALITPTGARPYQIQLCAFYMQRQTFAGEVCWVVVDDCQPRTTDFLTKEFRAGWEIIKVHPRPYWHAGQNTQGRNLAAGVAALLAAHKAKDIEAIYIIEDDDWYRATYLQEMYVAVRDYQLTAETHTVYYNIEFMRWHENQNDRWGSLFQTVFKPSVLSEFEKIYTEKFIDYVLFKAVTKGVNLFRRTEKLAIGIKGQAGRSGIGAGHRFNTTLKPDPTGQQLREYIGNDAKYYLQRELYDGHSSNF